MFNHDEIDVFLRFRDLTRKLFFLPRHRSLTNKYKSFSKM
jgi:hypothetical protein